MNKDNKHMNINDAGNRIPFSVPENYFEEFALKIDQQTGGVKVSVRNMVKPWMYLAAMFVGVIIISKTFYTVYTNNNLAKNTENYELYVVSQADESLVYDNYLNEEQNKEVQINNTNYEVK